MATDAREAPRDEDGPASLTEPQSACGHPHCPFSLRASWALGPCSHPRNTQRPLKRGGGSLPDLTSVPFPLLAHLCRGDASAALAVTRDSHGLRSLYHTPPTGYTWW